MNDVALWAPGRTGLGVRRWDQAGAAGAKLAGAKLAGAKLEQGAVPLVENKPLDLEDGLVVEFRAKGTLTNYRSGDYWLIPALTSARSEAGTIEWPGQDGAALALPPHGIAHHVAPLARYAPAPNTLQNLRMQFPSLAIPMP